MYLGVGNAKSLIEWFNGDRQSDFLLVFLAGHVNDAAFFSSLFEAKETIDVVSQERVAVFLFASHETMALKLQTGPGRFEILPGTKVLSPVRSDSNRFRPILISNIRDDVKTDVVKASTTFTLDFAKEYAIETTLMPALALFHKASPHPIVIPHRGRSELNNVLELVRELANLRAIKPKKPEKQTVDAKKKLRDAEHHYEKSATTLDDSVQRWKAYWEKKGVDIPMLDGITGRNAALMLQHADEQSVLTELAPSKAQFALMIRQASQDIDYQVIINMIRRHVVRYAGNTAAKERAQRLVNYYEELLAQNECKLEEVNSIRGRVHVLARKYEFLFFAKDAYKTSMEVISSVAGIQKKSDEVNEVSDTIRKLLGV